MDKLTLDLKEPGDHSKIDNTNGGFMAVVVEHIGTAKWQGRDIDSFSVAHYYQQNGDAMRKMTFFRINSYYFPAYFLQDNLGVEQESIGRDYETGRWWVRNKMQRHHTSFANTWMNNIKQQQGI